jgi:putative ABC transport system permease protein
LPGIDQIARTGQSHFIEQVAKPASFPLAWYGLNGFLQGYAYRTDLSWWVFGAAGAITLSVAMLTVIFKCIQAALANPVKSLRSE